MLGGWPATGVGEFVGSVMGLGIVFILGAHIAALVIAGVVAFSGSELAIHLPYGIRSAQGAPTHFAVLMAALIGVGLGALAAGRFGLLVGSKTQQMSLSEILCVGHTMRSAHAPQAESGDA